MCPQTLLVSFDPGCTNLAVVVARMDGGIKAGVDLLMQKVYNPSTKTHSPDISLLSEMMDEIDEFVGHFNDGVPVLWVIEYQPPLNTCSNPGLVRKNTWVEAFLVTWCWNRKKDWKLVASSAVKKKFKFPRAERGSQYDSNKRFSVEAARKICPELRHSDHLADCVLNAVYAKSRM
jgi:hypothetical protein